MIKVLAKIEGKPLKLVYIVLLASVLWGVEYVRRDLWEPDEARYAYVTGEMRSNGNWAVPHRNGVYYAHKPPLMFWLINVSSLLTGGKITNVSTRLPSLLGIILSLWATAQIAAMWHSRRAAWRSIFILSTTYLFWKVGGMGQIDALLCGLQMMALYHLFANDRNPSFWRPLLAYSFMGLAVLAKGPVGLLVPLGVYFFSTLIADGRSPLKKTHWMWGPIVTLLFPAMWLTWAWLEGAPSAYFSEIILHQNIDRAAGSFGHVKPFYYFLSHFPLDFLPWTFFLPAALAVAWRQKDQHSFYKRLFVWGVFVLLFFTLPSSKRNLYILLAFPAVSIFIAIAWDNLNSSWSRATGYSAIGLLGLLGTLLFGALFYRELPINRLLLLPSIAILLGGTVLLYRIFQRGRLSSAWFYCFFGVLFMNQLSVAAFVYPALNPLKTPVELAKAAKTNMEPGKRLLLYKMNGEIQALYCGVQGLKVDSLKELSDAMKIEKKGMIVFSRKDWEAIDPEFSASLVPHYYNMGHKKLLWCTFDERSDLGGYISRSSAEAYLPKNDR